MTVLTGTHENKAILMVSVLEKKQIHTPSKEQFEADTLLLD